MNTEETNENAPEKVESEQSKPAPVPAKNGDLEITAYDVKGKTKGVLMYDAVITKTAKNAYMAKGVSDLGRKLTTLMNGDKARAAVEAGIAIQGWTD